MLRSIKAARPATLNEQTWWNFQKLKPPSLLKSLENVAVKFHLIKELWKTESPWKMVEKSSCWVPWKNTIFSRNSELFLVFHNFLMRRDFSAIFFKVDNVLKFSCFKSSRHVFSSSIAGRAALVCLTSPWNWRWYMVGQNPPPVSKNLPTASKTV